MSFEAANYFINRCKELGFEHHEAFQIFWAYQKAEIIYQVGDRYAVVDEQYWKWSWLHAAIRFYETEHPKEMKFSSTPKVYNHKLSDYFEGVDGEDSH